MENEKPKLERHQKILVVISWLFFAAGLLLLIFSPLDIIGTLLALTALSTHRLLQSVAAWKQNPRHETVCIILYSMLLCASIVVLAINFLR